MLRGIRYVAALLGSLIIFSTVWAQEIVLKQKPLPEIRPDNPVVTMGDVFTVQSSSRSLAKKAGNIVLAEFRSPDRSQHIYDFSVERKLLEAGLRNISKIEAKFPIELQPENKVIPKNELAGMIEQYLGSQSDDKILWDLTRDPELKVFSGEAYEIAFTHSGDILPGRLALRGTLENGTYTQKFTLMLDVSVYKKVLVATESISRGTLLSHQNTVVQEKLLNIHQARYGLDGSGMTTEIEAVRNIESGDVILSNMIQRVKLIKPGDQVRLFVEMKGLKVQTTGEAIESGGISEKIRVRESGSGNILLGTIIDHQTIRINSTEQL